MKLRARSNLSWLVIPLAFFNLGCPDGADALPKTISILETTYSHACAIDTQKRLRCAQKGTGRISLGALEDNSYIALSATQNQLCALAETKEGSGDIHCFDPDLPDGVVVHEGPFIDLAYGDCGLDLDGELNCFNATGAGYDDPPAGPFVELYGFTEGMCARTADDTISCFGTDRFERDLQPEGTWGECMLPTTGILDMDFAGGPAVLTAEGVTGYRWIRGSCLSFDAPGATEVEFNEGTLCVLDGGGNIACTVIDEGLAEDDNLLEGDQPEGVFDHLASTGNGAFMCAAAGEDITCWGSGWNGGITETFTLTD